MKRRTVSPDSEGVRTRDERESCFGKFCGEETKNADGK